MRLLQPCKEPDRDLAIPCVIADALYGSAALMEEAAAVFDGIQVISHLRGSQKVRAYRREDHVTDYFASPPGTPQQSFIRGRELITAIGGRVSLSVGAHRTKPFIISLKYAGEGPYRSMKASERR